MRRFIIGLCLLCWGVLAQAGVAFVALAVAPDEGKDMASAQRLLASAAGAGTGEALVLLDVWHGLHYLTTGKDFDADSAVGQAIMGGAPLGVKGSKEPLRRLEPAQVQAIAAALGTLQVRELRKRFNPTRMEQLAIHPAGVWVGEGPAALDHVMAHFAPLRDFYAAAAKKGCAVLLSIE